MKANSNNVTPQKVNFEEQFKSINRRDIMRSDFENDMKRTILRSISSKSKGHSKTRKPPKVQPWHISKYEDPVTNKKKEEEDKENKPTQNKIFDIDEDASIKKLEAMIKSPIHNERCGMLSVALKMLQKEDEVSDKKLLRFELNYFIKRKIEPTPDQIMTLHQGVKKFTAMVIRKMYLQMRSKTIAMQKWKIKTFGIRKELSKIYLDRVALDIKHYYKERTLFSFKNFSRLTRKTYEAFNKWRFMVRLNYPLIERKKMKSIGIIFDIICNRNAIVDHLNKTRKGRKKQKIESIDQVDFYRKLTVGLNTLRVAFNKHYKEFFFSMSYLAYPIQHGSREIINRYSKISTKVPSSLAIPGTLALQIFQGAYRRGLLIVYKHLVGQARLIAMQHKLKELEDNMAMFRHRARAELIVKIYCRISKRALRRMFLKWKLQKDLRKVAKDTYKKAFAEGFSNQMDKSSLAHFDTSFRNNNKTRQLYEKMKEGLESMSVKYAKTMSQIVARNIMSEPQVIKAALNEQLDMCVAQTLQFM